MRRTYLKVHAKFRCIREKGGCGRWWNSSHFWINSDPVEWMTCQHCHQRGLLFHAIDEDIPMNTYRCLKGLMWEGCGKEEVRVQMKDPCCYTYLCDCKKRVLPEPGGPTEMRFGRHYHFRCRNNNCEGPSEWEQASFWGEVVQRCGRCGHDGNVMMIKMTSDPKGFVDDPPRRGGPRHEVRKESTGPHNPELCQMCQELKKQNWNLEGTCFEYSRVVVRVVENPDGSSQEKIVATYR